MAKNSAILHDRFPFYSGSFPDNITGSIRKVEKKPAKPTIRGFPKIIPNLQQKNLISARRTQKTIKRQTVS